MRNTKYKLQKHISLLHRDNWKWRYPPEADIALILELLHTTNAPSIKTQKHSNTIELNLQNLIIDLRATEETIHNNISKRTKTDTNRAAKKDRFNHIKTKSPSNKQPHKFPELFDSFAKEKNTPCNMNKLIAIRDCQSLVMSYVEDSHHKILCTGISVIDRENMQLYGLHGSYSTSYKINKIRS